ncbi:MAG: ABC transporter substrate-binding protein, partial [Geminicoccaceae bacterium]
MKGWRRRGLLATAAVFTALAWLSPTKASAEDVLRVIPHADLKVLDPIWTTAYISRNHGYLIYDTLFAMDE